MTAPQRNFVAAIITARSKDGIKILVQEVIEIPSRKKLLELPGGMSEIQDNGNPEKTLRAEVEEETGYLIKMEAEPRKVVEFPDSRGGLKIFYHLRKSDCQGTRRNRAIRDGDHILLSPRYLDLSEVMRHPRFRESHRRALFYLRVD